MRHPDPNCGPNKEQPYYRTGSPVAPLDHRVDFPFWDQGSVAQRPVGAAQPGFCDPNNTAEGDLDDRPDEHDAKHHNQEPVIHRAKNTVCPAICLSFI